MKILQIFILISLPLLLNAEEYLTLEKAIETGLKNNYGLIIAKNELEILKNNVSIGNAGFLPKIDLFGSAEISTNNVHLKSSTGFSLDKDAASADAINAGIAAKWTAFDGLQMFKKYESLKIQADIQNFQEKIKIENTIIQISDLYFNIIKQESLVDYWNEHLKLSNFRTEIAKISFEQGIGSELDYLKAQVEQNFDASDLEKQKAVLTSLKASMNEVLSRNIATDFVIKDSIPTISQIEYQTALQNMLIKNKELLASEQNKELSSVEADLVLSKYYPSIDFKIGANYFNSTNHASLINRNYGFALTLGVSANFNIFDGGNDSRKLENSYLNVINADIKNKQLSLWLESHLYRVYQDYLVNKHLINIENENIIFAEKNMLFAQESYKNGSISSLEFRETQQNLLEAKYRLIISKFNAKINELELFLISGQIY